MSADIIRFLAVWPDLAKGDNHYDCAAFNSKTAANKYAPGEATILPVGLKVVGNSFTKSSEKINTSTWRPIETAPKDANPIDLWCGEDNRRLANYFRMKISPDNIYYAPVFGGRSVVRTATHWMPIPKGPE